MRLATIFVVWLVVAAVVNGWNAGTSWRNLYSSVILKNDGTVSAYGTATLGGDNNAADKLKDVKAIFSTQGAIIALMHDETVTSWGSPDYGGNATMFEGLGNVKMVFTGTYDISLLHEDKTVTCLHKLNPMLYTEAVERYVMYKPNITETEEIYTNDKAFVGVTKNGVPTAWGLDSSGGITPPTIGKVKAIYASGDAFVGHQVDGKLRSWGQSVAGGCEDTKFNNDDYTCMPLDIEGVITVYSNAFAFAALVEKDMSIIAWGRSLRGGDIGEHPVKNVAAVYSTRYAFAALKKDGTVFAWGDPSAGGNNSVPLTLTDVVSIFASEKAFVALKKDRTITVWGSSRGTPPQDLSNVQTVFGNYEDFAALHTDGTVTSWGGGQTTTLKDVTFVYGNMQNFMATHYEGTVSHWGFKDFDAQLIPDLSGVKTVYMTDITYSSSVNPNFYTCPQYYDSSRSNQCTDRHGGEGGGGGIGGEKEPNDGDKSSSSSDGHKEDLTAYAIACMVLFVAIMLAMGVIYYQRRSLMKPSTTESGQAGEVNTSTDNPIVMPPPPPVPSEAPPSRETAIFDSDDIYYNDEDEVFSGQSRPSWFAGGSAPTEGAEQNL